MSRLFSVVPMALFGALWVNLGLQLGHADLPWAGAAAAVFAFGLIGLALWRSRSGQGPRPPVVRSLVWLSMGGEVVAALVGMNILSAVHRMDLVTPVLALIVGLHFLPLARAFSAPIYVRTGLALTAIGLVGFALEGDARPLAEGAGAALVLWTTCALVLARPSPARPSPAHREGGQA